jgi:hypothetical protein
VESRAYLSGDTGVCASKHPVLRPMCRSRTRRTTSGAARPLGGALRVRSDRVRPPLGAVCRTEPFLQPDAPRAAALCSVCARIPVADGYSPSATLSAVSTLRAASTSSPRASTHESRAYLSGSTSVCDSKHSVLRPMAGPAPAARPLPNHSAVHSGSVPTACARHSARSIAPNLFSSRLRPGAAALPAFEHAFPSPTVISPARQFLRCLH